jgi:hypothetical protein
MTKFISDELESGIYVDVVDRTFPKMLDRHKMILKRYMYGLVQYIAVCYDFYKDIPNFTKKISQNNYKDLRWLMMCLLPFINSNRKLSDITDLNELYGKQYDQDQIDPVMKQQIIESKIDSINFVQPKYFYSNIQFGRSVRNNSVYKEIGFDESHLRDNYYLMLDTIKTTRYKLYINWIDILPHRMDTYQKTKLYTETNRKITDGVYEYWDPLEKYPLADIAKDETIRGLISSCSGLNVEDLYNTMSSDLYDSIVRHKWMIFDIAVQHSGGTRKPCALIQILSMVMDLGNCVIDNDWTVLTAEEKERFTNSWDTLRMVYEGNKSLANSKLQISQTAVNTMVKSIVVFFDNKYNTRSNVKSGYVPLSRRSVRENVDDYEDERMSFVSDRSVLKTVKSIRHIDIYEFFREALQSFKNTWYSKNLLTDDRKKISDISKGSYKNMGDKFVTYKNIYNFCKSFVHVRKATQNQNQTQNQNRNQWFSDEFVRFPKSWTGLNDIQKNIILDRINNRDRTWFNISRNLLFTMRGLVENLVVNRQTNAFIQDFMNTIYDEIRKSLAEIVFETMIMRGTLSYFVAENDLTNTSMYDINITSHKIALVREIAKRRFGKDNPHCKNSYYYLTNRPFDDTGTFYINIGEGLGEYNYRKTCSTVGTAWYLATTFHWIAQVGFCHRFINTRVNYITGGTGAGKTTQVPKLYLYYLKAIDHVDDGTVMITVPRKNISTGVSEFISHELSVPYKEIDRVTKKEHKNDNFYVQFKHMKDDHIKSGNFPKIKYVTDGSVLQDAKDPMLKNKLIFKDSFIYLKRNKYDVIVVDEAHEHNANMDLILSLTRNSVYYNNQLRLVIMSATMDADEPTYRRFYRDVNDNRKYPLNKWIEKHRIDRVNIDRRFHISPPDETTRFKIDEHYRPDADPVEIVKEIIKNSTGGDILLFRPGVNEIVEAISQMNQLGFLPSDCIALPYHAKLRDPVKKFIENIDKNLKNLSINKSDDFGSMSEDVLFPRKESNESKYKRAIIVATNIAEASITIPSLKFVVDTGLEKIMVYDFERRAGLLKPNYITEASRIQRKGRVGRKSSGTVYYTYKEGSLKNNKKQFNISIEDLHMSVMLKMLRDVKDVPIFTDQINRIVSAINLGQNIDTGKDNLSKLINDGYSKMYRENGITIDDNKQKYITSIIDQMVEQYFTDDRLYGYYGNDQHNDYQNNSTPPNIYISGFDVEQLTDSLGMFYIVHPDELNIARNIGGDVTQTDNYVVTSELVELSRFKRRMRSNKIIVFWETLVNMGFVGITKDGQLFRTELGSMLQYCSTGITSLINLQLVDLLFFGYGLSKNDDEFNVILSIVAMLEILDSKNGLRELSSDKTVGIPTEQEKEKEKNSKNMIRAVVGSSKSMDSDIRMLTDICQIMDRMIRDNQGYDDFLKSKYLQSSKFMGEDITNIVNELPPDLPADSTERRNSLEKRNKRLDLVFERHLLDTASIINRINKNTNFFNNIHLDPLFISKYLKTRERLRREFNDLVVGINDTDETQKDIQTIRVLLKNHRLYADRLNIDFVKTACMLANPYNVMIGIPRTSTYLALYNPHPDTLLSVKPTTTYVDPPYLQNYLLCMNQNVEFGSMNVLISINPNDLRMLANIYNIKEITRKISSEKLQSKKMHIHIDEYLKEKYKPTALFDDLLEEQPVPSGGKPFDPRKKAIPEHIISLISMSGVLKNAMIDIIKIQDSDIWDIYSKLGVGYSDYARLLRQ